MNGKLIVRLGLIGLLAFVLYLNGKSLKENSFIKKNEKTIGELPPSLQVTSVALGPMKGLLADIIWWRAERMLENKEFFESLQLAEWLTALQPTYESVWEYQGFNLAFNISKNFTDVEERWKWILAGIEILRDRGLVYNPDWENNRKIRAEIVNIFYRKLAEVSDVEAQRFQDKWTLIMLKYLDSGNAEELTLIKDAYKDLNSLVRDEDVISLSNRLNLNSNALSKMVIESPPNLSSLVAESPQTKSFNSAIRKIYRFTQRRRLKEELNMDIDRMIKIDTDYGPLDWRTHQAQLIYWGAEDNIKNTDQAAFKYSQIVRAAMVTSFYNGRILFSEDRSYFMRTHNLEMVPRILDYFTFALSEYDAGSRDYKMADNAKRDFLERAAVICYNYNQMDAANSLFEQYKGYLERDGRTMSFEQFIVQGMERSLKQENYKSRRAFLESIITKALEDAALGEWGRYQGYTKLIRMIYKMHQRKHANSPARLLPPLNEIINSAKQSYAKKKNKTEDDLAKIIQEAEKFKEPAKKLNFDAN